MLAGGGSQPKGRQTRQGDDGGNNIVCYFGLGATRTPLGLNFWVFDTETRREAGTVLQRPNMFRLVVAFGHNSSRCSTRHLLVAFWVVGRQNLHPVDIIVSDIGLDCLAHDASGLQREQAACRGQMGWLLYEHRKPACLG